MSISKEAMEIYDNIWEIEARSCPTTNHRNHDAELRDGVVVMQCRDCDRVILCSQEIYREIFEVVPVNGAEL